MWSPLFRMLGKGAQALSQWSLSHYRSCNRFSIWVDDPQPCGKPFAARRSVVRDSEQKCVSVVKAVSSA
jgi:hypothetical protein